ncbi:AMP-binding protein [Oxalobacteraceae bacterium CAVE-383]|nr:AMP-binding protein [Oxalobacteraceae bacterium CAVE-383]
MPANPADMLRLPYAGCGGGQTVAYRGAQLVDADDFHARIAAWRQLLTDRPGCRFALFLEDSLEFGAALYGAWLAGKTIYLPGDALPATCAALSMTVDGFLGDFEPVWSPLSPLSPLPSLSSPPALEAAALPPPAFRLPADFEGLVVYTSGSSGQAQAIPKRLSQLAAEVTTLERLFGARLGEADVLATVSHQHIYGLLFKVLWPLAAQRIVHAGSAVFLEELLPWMQSRPCALVSSPAHLTRFPDSAALPAATDAPHLRAVFSSGGPLPAAAAEAAAALFGSAPIEIYGSSETGGIAWRSGAERWSAMPGVQWRLGSEHENENDSGGHADIDGGAAGTGVLEVRSAHLRDTQWLRMADRAAAIGDADSLGNAPHFILLGRTDRIVKLAEKRISLDAIERRLGASPLVATVRVMLHTPAPGAKSMRAGIAAFIVLSASGRAELEAAGKPALNRQLKIALAGAVPAIALPRRWRYLDALPQNAQGKTTQAELLALLAPPHPPPPPRPILPGISLLRQDVYNVLLALRIDADLLYFDGHFDGTPVLPGVAQLNWAITLGRRYFRLPPVFAAVHALKFQQIIAPGSSIMLELQHEPSKGALHFRLYSDAGPHASGRIVFIEGGDV